MKVPLVDLKSQYLSIKKEIDAVVKKVIESGQYIQGEEVELFEESLARYCQAKYAIGVSSGTDALFLALKALDIGPGDEVITVPFTFMATAEVISLTGAQPVFVDINPRNFNVDVDKIEKAITKKTKAIIPVHLYGQSADMDAINNIARKHKLVVIEDAAQSIGAEYKGKKVGGISTVGTLSFFPAKNLGACGDAGAILTNRKDMVLKLKMLREHGSEKKYYHEYIGTNSRLDTLQAAILRVKLKYLDQWTEKRRKMAEIYNEILKSRREIILPVEESFNKHVYNQYTIRLRDRDSLRDFLAKNDIASASYYPLPLHLQKAFADLGYKNGDFPESEKASKEVLSVPIWPELGIEKINYVAEKINSFFE